MNYLQNLAADLHIGILIPLALVLGGMFIWAGWCILKMFLNMFGVLNKRSKKIEA